MRRYAFFADVTIRIRISARIQLTGRNLACSVPFSGGTIISKEIAARLVCSSLLYSPTADAWDSRMSNLARSRAAGIAASIVMIF